MGNYIGKSESTKETLALLKAGLYSQVPAILWGPPGIGKTALVKAIAHKTRLPLFILLMSAMDPTDVGGLPTIKTVERHDPVTGQVLKYNVTEPALNYWADELLRTGEGILFFDEASNATPAVQATFLSTLQGRTVGHITLPDTVWMVAAANGEEEAADGWTLAPPMANRLLHIDYMVDLDDWVTGMIRNWDDPVPEENTPEYAQFITLMRQRSEIAGFVKENPQFLIKVPDDLTEAGRAWPSPRSWDAAARMLSTIPKSEATARIRHKILLGSVGIAATEQYRQYENSMRLPAYETVIETPERVSWNDISASEQRLTLDMVIALMNRDNAQKTTNVIKVFVQKTSRPDMVASIADEFSAKIDAIGMMGTMEGAGMIATVHRVSNSAANDANLALGLPNRPAPPSFPRR